VPESARCAGDAAVAPQVFLNGGIVRHNFAEQKEIMLADAPRVFADGIAENRRGGIFQVFDGIDAKAIQVGVGNPVLCTLISVSSTVGG